MTSDRKQLLPIHFLSQTEAGNEEVILQQWLDVCATGKKKFLVKYQNNNSYILSIYFYVKMPYLLTENGLVVAKQRIVKPPLLVAQMTEEWLNHYRKLA